MIFRGRKKMFRGKALKTVSAKNGFRHPLTALVDIPLNTTTAAPCAEVATVFLICKRLLAGWSQILIHSALMPNPAISLTGREKAMAPALVSGPAFSMMAFMMAAFCPAAETMRMTSFSEAMETR